MPTPPAGSPGRSKFWQLDHGRIADPAFAVAYAGDEFVIVMPGQDTHGATAVAAEIRDRLAARHFLESAGYAIRLSASFGIAVYPDDAAAMDELLALADHALFAAKRAGRHQIRVASADTPPPRTSDRARQAKS